MQQPLLVKKIIDTDKVPLDEIFSAKGRIVTFLNPVSYLDAMKHPGAFEPFDYIFADGSVLAKAIHLAYGPRVVRRSFDMTSLARRLFNYAQANGKSIYFVASRQNEVEKAVSHFKAKYPGLKIAGYRNGYFANEEERIEECRKIAELDPDFLIVGMGAVNQERFIQTAREQGYRGVSFTCGGFIHQTCGGQQDFYPEWADRWNLRFVYRMYKEKHTRKRYAKAAFVFPLRFILQRLTR